MRRFLRAGARNIIYEPEQFPAGILRIGEPAKVSISARYVHSGELDLLDNLCFIRDRNNLIVRVESPYSVHCA